MNNPDNEAIIFDTTLRDGAQALEKQITSNEGVCIVKALEDAGVDVAELPMVNSNANRRMIHEICKATSNIQLAAFVRDGVEQDIIDAAGVLDEPIRQGRVRIAMLTPTAECLREAKEVSKEEAVKRMTSGIKNAVKEFIFRNQPPDIQIYFEGASEVKDLSFMDELTRIALQTVKQEVPEKYYSGIKMTLDYPDTHGTAGRDFTRWDEYGDLHRRYSKLSQDLAGGLNLRHVVTAAHCHNDSNEAVNNSLRAYLAGARQIDGTVLGVGERSGNTDLIKLVYKLVESDRKDLLTVLPVKLRSLAETVGPVFGVDYERHPIVGDETGSTAAGVHGNKILESVDSYVKKDPSRYGAPNFLFKVGPAMGKSVTCGLLREMGVFFPVSVCETIYHNYLQSIEEGYDENYKGVDGRERFIERFIYRNPEVIRQAERENGKLIHLGKFDPKSSPPAEKGGKRKTHLDFSYIINGVEKKGSGVSTGGSLDIVQKVITNELGLHLTLTEWLPYNISRESDSEVVVKVTMRCNQTGQERTGFSIEGDTKIASVQAMLHAISSFPEALKYLSETAQNEPT
jgi:2-isopropylmalate synthase